jgi:hypothetical protein
VAAFEIPRGWYRPNAMRDYVLCSSRKAKEEPCRIRKEQAICLARTDVEGQHQSTSKTGLGHEKSKRYPRQRQDGGSRDIRVQSVITNAREKVHVWRVDRCLQIGGAWTLAGVLG